MIYWRTLISGSAGVIFAIFSPNKSVLGADDLSGPLFRYLKGHCHGNRFCEKIENSLLSSLWHPEREWNIATSMCILTAQMTPVYRVKISWNSVQQLQSWQSSFVNVWYDTAKNWRILSNISGSTGPIVAIFTPYESALGDDDKSGPYVPIWHGTLPW